MASEDFRRFIIDLEDQTWQALCTSGKDLLPYLSDDCNMLFPLGMRVAKDTEPSLKEVMESDAYVPWKKYKMSDIQVTVVNQDGAVVSYKIRASRPGEDGHHVSFHALISSVWRRRLVDGKHRWECCSHQQTPYEVDARDLMRDDDDRGRHRSGHEEPDPGDERAAHAQKSAPRAGVGIPDQPRN